MRVVSAIEHVSQEKYSLVESEINFLLETHGKVEQQQIIERARDPQSPLHDIFEWDDTTAAIEHRLLQARQLIRVIVLRPHMGSPNPQLRIAGSGRLVQIVRGGDNPPRRGRPRTVTVDRAPSGLLPEKQIPTAVREEAALIPPSLSPEDDELEEESESGKDTLQKIRNEIIALSSVKSRLVRIPEAIDIAKGIRTVISNLESLMGRIGKSCSQCGLRNHIAGDGMHECLQGSCYSGTTNLGSPG